VKRTIDFYERAQRALKWIIKLEIWSRV
jgi:hypothetical protein